MRNILVIAEIAERGGTRTYLDQLGRLLAQKKIDYSMKIVSGDKIPGYSSEDGTIIPVGRLLNLPILNYLQGLIFFWRHLQGSSPQDTEVVVSCGTPGLFVFPFLNSWKVTYILHTYPHGRLQLLLGRLTGFLIPKSWTVVSVSDFSKERIMKCWKPKARVITLLTGVPDSVQAKNSALRTSQGTSKNLSLLCVAACETYKNPSLWLEVATLLDAEFQGQLTFSWVGGGREIFKMRERVKSLGLGARITFHGWTDDVDAFYSSADLYYQLSTVESLGISLVDAARFGLPTVVAGNGGMPEVVVHGKTGYVLDSATREEVARTIATLIRDNDLRRSMAINARSHYEANFQIARWEKDIIETIQRPA